MLNETDLTEYYEWLDKKTKQANESSVNGDLFEQQLHHLRELIRIQNKILGIKL